MTPRSSLRVLLAGGGSGGSSTPVIAVAQELRRLHPDTEFLYLGTRDGPEEALVKAHGLPYVGIAAGKLRRYWDWRNVVDPARVIFGLGQAYGLVRRFRPSVAFAAGGFASVSPMVAGRLAGAHTLIHQQDVIPGLANRLLVPFAERITVSLPSSLAHFPAGRTSVTGNPVRAEVLEANAELAFAHLGLDRKLPLVVATGGGTGARGLNKLIAAAAPRLTSAAQVVHLTGRGRHLPLAAPLPGYQAIELLVQDMPHLLAAATLVVTRAGMGTLTELAALEKASLVIPMPSSHQAANAASFAMVGAVEVAEEETLTPDSLADRVLSLLGDDPRREELGRVLGRSMPRDAAARIAQQLLDLASE